MNRQALRFFTSLLMITLIFNSCTEDDPFGTDTGLSPSIRLVDALGFISTSTSLEANAVLQFRITASAGDDPLDRLTIKENGQNVDLSRITFESGSSFVSNPALLLGATNQQGFTEDVLIAGPSSPGNYNYTFEVLDQAGIVSNTGITVSIELISPTLLLTDSSAILEAGPGSTRTISVDAAQGTADLSTIAVYENEVLLDASRLAYDNNGLTPFLANPESTPTTNAFQTGIAIQVATMIDSIPYTYRIELRDAEGLSASVSVDILVQNTIDTSYTGVLVYNKDGNQLGGLNLYDGSAVAFNSSNAQIRDLGIDLNLPLASNWLQKIRAVNSAQLRIPGNNQVENFSFENTNSRDALIAAYNNGVDIGDSDKVQVDDIFLVKNNDDYFILKVTQVMVTPSDNNDFYEFSIKKSEF